MIPSAPHAIAAFDIGAIKSRLPVPCDGSTIIGYGDLDFIIGIELKSKVLRVAVSNVRIPRSHKIICSFPFFEI